MKICFVGLDNLPVLAEEYNSHGIGGEQVQQTLLAKAFNRRGFETSMVVYDYGQPDGASWDGVHTLRAFRQDAGLPIVRFVFPRWTKLWDALRRADADIYYASCSGARVGQIAHFVRRRNHRLVFRVAHDLDCHREVPLVKHRRDKWLYRYGLRHAHSILVQTERQRAFLRNDFGLESVIAGMLVEQPNYDLGYHNRDIDVLWVNNLNRIKRPGFFVQLAGILPELRSHMIGGPQPGYEWLFAEIARDAAIVPSLHFHGRVPYHDVNDFYARARLFVNTSESEGFPNSYLQAWIRGTPVVAFFDPDGIIAREGLGAVVTSEEEMQGAVRRFATDPKVWEVTSHRCRDYMRRHFDEEQILKPYLAAILGNSQGAVT